MLRTMQKPSVLLANIAGGLAQLLVVILPLALFSQAIL